MNPFIITACCTVLLFSSIGCHSHRRHIKPIQTRTIEAGTQADFARKAIGPAQEQPRHIKLKKKDKPPKQHDIPAPGHMPY